MKDYYLLSNRGRALRLRQLAQAALEHYELDVKQVRLITNHYNGVFGVVTADGRKYVLRVCLPYPNIAAQLTAELAWLRAIRQGSNLPVPEPILTRNGDMMVAVEAEGVPEQRHCVLFGWLSGTDLGESLTLPNIEQFGAFAAKLHLEGAKFQPPPNIELRACDKVFYFDEPVIMFDEADETIMPESRHEFFQSVVDRIQNAIEHLKNSGEPLRVIHGDLHSWNVKVFRGQIAAFDFEELMLGWPVQDIGITMYYFYGQENYPEIYAAFKRGYETAAPWPERYEGEVHTFIAQRNMVLANTVLHHPKVDENREIQSYLDTTERRLRALFAGEPFDIKYW